MEILTAIAPINVLAEIPDYAVGDALDILQNHSYISNQLAESFQTVWNGTLFDTTSSYWRAIIAGALDFALLGMILYAWEGFKIENEKRQQYMINGIVMVIILSILLGGNGLLTSNILRITHSFDQNLTRTLANTQILDLTIADSLKNISLSNNARDEVDRLLAECNELTGDEALQCMEQQVPEIQKIADAAEANDPIANSPAAKYAKGILSYLQELGTNVVNGDGLKVAAQLTNTLFTGNPVMMAVIKVVFGGIQLAFNFGILSATNKNTMNTTKTKLTHNSNQKVVLYQLITLSIVMINGMISCSNSSKIAHVNQNQIMGVQLADGQVVTAQTSKVNDRSNLVINNFVEKWLYLSFNWTTDDLTVEVEKTKAKVPGNVYASTFAVTTKKDFRQQYIKQFAELIGSATGKKSSIQSAIRIDHISPKPTKISEGLWEVTVVSTWTGLDTSNGKEVFEIPFNKKLRLKSIPIAGKPTFTNPEEITQLQSIVNEINQYGLQITELENYDPR